jgi:hypothetical protein
VSRTSASVSLVANRPLRPFGCEAVAMRARSFLKTRTG